MPTEFPPVIGSDGVRRLPWWHHAGMRCMAALAPGWRMYDEVHNRTQYDVEHLRAVQSARLRTVLRLDDDEAADPLHTLAHRPILTKQQFITGLPRLRSGLVDPVDVLRVRTSGTTGDPIVIEHHEPHLVENVADQLRMLAAYGFAPGVHVLRVTCDPRHGLVSFTPQPAHVVKLQLRINVSKVDGSNAAFVNQLCREFTPQVVWGQPMEMLVAAKRIRSGLLANPDARMVWTHGDTINGQTRTALREVFQAEHRDLYGLQEFGHLGWECSNAPGTYHLNEERALVERDADGALVLTNLINTATQIVRYRPEDRAELIDEACPCGRRLRRLANIQGRQRGFIVDREDHPMNIKPLHRHLEELPLLRWQVRQERPGVITVAIVLDEATEPPGVDELGRRCRSMLNLIAAEVQVVSLEDLMTERGKAPQFQLFATQRRLAADLGVE